MRTPIKIRFGFTLVELMVTILIAMLVMAGIGVLMVDSIRSFGKMYERTTGNYQRADAGVIPDSYVARAAFDSVCRKASKGYNKGIDGTKNWVAVYYYSSVTPTLTAPDKCAYFAWDNTQKNLTVSYGDAVTPYIGTEGKLFPNPILLAKYVTDAKFDIQGSSVMMSIKIDNSADIAARQKMMMMVTCAAQMHDE